MKNYFKNIWISLWTVLVGMKITFMHLFTKSVTIQYPDERLQLPERERNRLFVNMDDCIGCDQCARACPVSCIYLETVKAVPGDIVGRTGVTSNGKKKALFVPTFTIDIAKCCYCELCVFPCPTECIYMTDVFEFSTFDRTKLIYEFTDMTPEQTAEKKKKLEIYNKEQDEKKKAAAAAKAKADAEAKAKAEAEAKLAAENEKNNNQTPDLKQTEKIMEKQLNEKKDLESGKIVPPVTTKTEPTTKEIKIEEDKKD
jgi:NADH-quinone oxidoreductase subunit I